MRNGRLQWNAAKVRLSAAVSLDAFGPATKDLGARDVGTLRSPDGDSVAAAQRHWTGRTERPYSGRNGVFRFLRHSGLPGSPVQKASAVTGAPKQRNRRRICTMRLNWIESALP